jgi:hypothetical protein
VAALRDGAYLETADVLNGWASHMAKLVPKVLPDSMRDQAQLTSRQCAIHHRIHPTYLSIAHSLEPCLHFSR